MSIKKKEKRIRGTTKTINEASKFKKEIDKKFSNLLKENEFEKNILLSEKRSLRNELEYCKKETKRCLINLAESKKLETTFKTKRNEVEIR